MVLMIAYQGKNKLTAKHIVEEAMTEAFVRKCNNCNKVFVKEDGCNRIKCGCGNLQCYVCEMNVVDYTHFDKPGGGRICPLYGEMHLKEQVAVAQERTVRELLNNRAELEDDDIRVDKEMSVNASMDFEAPRPPVVELHQARSLTTSYLGWVFVSRMS
jgi:TRIAD3 protein (E3 ubiquitin-protein ligase RNF216)